MNVFSAFNGIGCASYVLQQLGIEINKYYASEIDPRANFIATKNYPKTIHFGDITKIKAHHFLDTVDFMCGGSPCQDLSIAGKMAGLDGSRSKLFFEFIRLWNELGKPLFFFENVRMKKHSQDRISELFGCEPIYFDSALVSAQTRKRLYWTNVITKEDFVYPEDKGIVLNDILEYGQDGYVHEFRGESHKYRKVEKASCVDANYFKGIDNHQARTCIKIGENDNPFESSSRVYSPFGKSPCINTQGGGDQEIKISNVVCMTETRTDEAKQIRKESMKNGRDFSPRRGKELMERKDGKVNCITATQSPEQIIKITTHSSQPRNGKGQGGKGHLQKEDGKAYCIDTQCSTMIEYADTYRKLTPIEVERCFGLPDNYTKGVSTSARYHGLGNGWECATVADFFKYLIPH